MPEPGKVRYSSPNPEETLGGKYEHLPEIAFHMIDNFDKVSAKVEDLKSIADYYINDYVLSGSC